jgi:hypothetical protein
MSRYANERLAAMGERIVSLEGVIERAIMAIGKLEAPDACSEILTSGLMETFEGALLCDPDTTDEQLDEWLPEIARHEAEGGSHE